MSLLIFIIGLNLSTGQERERNKPSMVFADTVISNGWIILHGRLLDRPFHFHLENDTFWINSMQYLPPPPDPLQKPPEWIPEHTELGKWYFERSEIFVDSCRVKYQTWRRVVGVEKARDSLLQYVNTQKLIKVKEFDISHDGSSGHIVFDYKHLDLMNNPTPLHIEVFNKPGNEYIDIGLMFSGESADSTISQGEIYFTEYNSIKQSLAADMFLFLDYSGRSEKGIAKGYEIEYINTIKNILAKPISEDQMKQELNEKLNISPLDSKYIIYHRYHWLQNTEGRRDD